MCHFSASVKESLSLWAWEPRPRRLWLDLFELKQVALSKHTTVQWRKRKSGKAEAERAPPRTNERRVTETELDRGTARNRPEGRRKKNTQTWSASASLQPLGSTVLMTLESVGQGLLPNYSMKYWFYNHGKADRKGGNKDNKLQNLSVQILLMSSLCVITTMTFRRPKSEVLHSCIMNSQDRKGGEGDGDLLASKVILMMCWNSLALLGSLDWFNLKWPRSNHSWQPRGWGGPRNCRARGNGLILLLTGVTSIHPVRLIKKGCDLLEQNNGSLQI